jgi:hypothetical protein
MTEISSPSKRNIYIKAALYIILILIAGFFLVIFIFGGVMGLLLTGNTEHIISGIVYFVLFIIVASLAKKLENAYEEFERIRGIKKQTTRENFKENLPFILVIISTLIFAWIFESYFLSFQSNISSELAIEILKTILTVNGILIGFDGVVLAQLLWAIHSKGNIIYEKMLEKAGKEEIVQELKKEIKQLSRKRLRVIASIFYSMMPLLASILLSLNKLTLTYGLEVVSPRELLFDPLLGLLTGVILLILVMLQTNLLPSLEK